MANFGDLLEESRETLLELTADAVAAYARQRSRTRAEPEADASAQEPAEGDFLQDFLHLNLQYMNQLARLGSNYSVVAGRLLERVYDRYVREDTVAQEPASSRVEGPSRRTLAARLSVANPERRRMAFRAAVGPFRAPRDKKAHTLELRLLRPARPLAGAELSVGAKQHVELELELELPRSLKAGLEYRGEIVLEAEDGSLRIVRPLAVCRTAS